MYEDLQTAYADTSHPFICLGGILVNQELIPNAPVNLVLKTFNRHGLIAGATGSGKTKTIQVLTEQLSQSGVPVLVMDIKGDLSGLAMPGTESETLTARNRTLNLSYKPKAVPAEFLTLDPADPGVPLRTTVQDFGPLLFSRMLDVNETQEGVLTVLFEYAKAAALPLIDLNDLKNLLLYLQTEEGKNKIAAQFGPIASSSAGILMRKMIELESQGGGALFGEPAFNVMDLIRTNQTGEGMVSIVRLLDMQDKPKLFSTFMLKLLSDLYSLLPEVGDPEKPKLILFIDEAHLIFNQANKALLTLLETVVKLIRSKGVGLIFCTQTPDDIPESILGQLGLKIQHALRAFTAKDRKAMKLAAQNFPASEYYKTETLLTELGIGEALLSSLNIKGQPTPLIDCMIRAPESRMGVLTAEELSQHMSQSVLYSHYSQKLERSSAQDKLAAQKSPPVSEPEQVKKPTVAKNDSLINAVTKNTLFRQIVRQVMRDLMRALMTALGIKRKP